MFFLFTYKLVNRASYPSFRSWSLLAEFFFDPSLIISKTDFQKVNMMKLATLFTILLALTFTPMNLAFATKFDDLHFQGRSREMINTVIDVTPRFLRPVASRGMREGIVKLCASSGVVTQDDVIDLVKLGVPKRFLAPTLKLLEA